MKEITKQQWLEAFAFYTLACQHYAKLREFEAAMLKAIGHKSQYDGYGDQLSDAIYTDDKHPSFDDVLKKVGYVVEENPQP